MKKPLPKFYLNPFLLILVTVLMKIPVFFTKHIQEDSFITWRVARNLLDFGVIGFNGEERISASTTHLYVLVSAAFQMVFGSGFIYPLLIFSCVLFAVGTLWLAKILFSETPKKQGTFVLLLNMVPPALTASCLGMEYGILFFLYCGLLYFGIFKSRNWAYLVFPILLLWTRLDAVLFLGIFFIADVFVRRKFNYIFLLGGIIGLASVLSFNFLYFGELVNHTITAKKVAYKNLVTDSSWQYILYQWAYYGGLIKKYSLFTFAVFVGFLFFLVFCLIKILRNRTEFQFTTKVLLLSMAAFALFKITVFALFKAYFDWYYWLPRVFLFAVVLCYFLQFFSLRSKITRFSLILLFASLYFFQVMQSYAIGYMEERQRHSITNDISAEKTGLNHSILLEPAGIIPFYTGLYTYDEVGLVNKKVTAEMIKNEEFWWINTVKNFRPDYILTVGNIAGALDSYYHLRARDRAFFQAKYQLVKTYRIAEIHKNSPALLRWIYKIRPIGKDYHLYRKI